jgi:hypothetical protein
MKLLGGTVAGAAAFLAVFIVVLKYGNKHIPNNRP